MSTLQNLFIIGTPLQLINAIEAVKYFELENNILILIHRSRESNKTQMQNILNSYQWKEIIEIPYSKNSSFLQYIKLVKYLKAHTYKYIFTAKLEIVPKIVIANTTKEKVFLLDDGTLTIDIYEKQIKLNKINKYDLKELRFLPFGLKIKIRDIINLFTYFDLKPIGNMEIFKNELIFLRTTHLENANKDDDVIYFLGQPAQRYVDDEDYINSIFNLIKLHNKKIFYIPHRGESAKIKDIFLSANNPMLEVLNTNMPIELYFLENKIYPLHFIAYYTTALITLNFMYPKSCVEYITIQNSYKIDRFLTDIYKIYNEAGFKPLHLEI